MNAVVIGRSNIVGKPMAQLAVGRQLHRDDRAQPHQGFARRCARADIVVAAVGRPEMVPGRLDQRRCDRD